MFNQIAEAVLEGNEEEVTRLVNKALAEGYNPLELINKGGLPGIGKAGDLFEQEEIFLPELILAGEAMKAAMSILEPILQKNNLAVEKIGKFVIGTVEGDMHDIGKNIVASLLTASGYEVVDLGTDVPAEKFIDQIRITAPCFLGLSALLTTTMIRQKEIIEILIEEGLREQVKVFVGGAPVTAAWAENIGADAYAENAIEGVKMAKTLARL